MGYTSELFKLPCYWDDANMNYQYCCLMRAYRNWKAGGNWMSKQFANFEDTYAFKEFNYWENIDKIYGAIDHMKWIEDEDAKFGAGTDMFESISLADGCSDSAIVEDAFVYNYTKLGCQFGAIDEENIRSIYNALKRINDVHRLEPVIANRGFVYTEDPDATDFYIKTTRHIDGIEAWMENDVHMDIDASDNLWDAAIYTSPKFLSYAERNAVDLYTNAIVDIVMENDFDNWTYYFVCGY